VTRVATIIFHPRAAPGAGPLSEALASSRRQNAERQATGFRAAGAAATILEGPADDLPFGRRVREAVNGLAGPAPGGLILLGSGSIPLARAADHRVFVATAAGPAGHVLANNRFSADVVAVGGAAWLADLPDLSADNGLPRWLAETTGFDVADVRHRWRLQVDLDSPLDVLLVRRGELADGLSTADVPTGAARAALAAVHAASRNPGRELVVAGRLSADGLAWLERSTASRTRALVEERGFRTRRNGQRPARSTLGLLLDRDGPGVFGTLLAELGDAAVVDSRVLLAHRFGADERGWPVAEDRFASDLLLPDRVADPWLKALTRAALDAPIPIVLGGHSLVGPGLRLALGADRTWT
jgi:CTP:molybdopterin cytidylyltransferase MocA